MLRRCYLCLRRFQCHGAQRLQSTICQLHIGAHAGTSCFLHHQIKVDRRALLTLHRNGQNPIFICKRARLIIHSDLPCQLHTLRYMYLYVLRLIAFSQIKMSRHQYQRTLRRPHCAGAQASGFQIGKRVLRQIGDGNTADLHKHAIRYCNIPSGVILALPQAKVIQHGQVRHAFEHIAVPDEHQRTVARIHWIALHACLRVISGQIASFAVKDHHIGLSLHDYFAQLETSFFLQLKRKASHLVPIQGYCT